MADMDNTDHLVHQEKETKANGYDNEGYHYTHRKEEGDEEESPTSSKSDDDHQPVPNGRMPPLNGSAVVVVEDDDNDQTNKNMDEKCHNTPLDTQLHHYVPVEDIDRKILNGSEGKILNGSEGTIPEDVVINLSSGRVRARKPPAPVGERESIPLEDIPPPSYKEDSEKAELEAELSNHTKNGVWNEGYGESQFISEKLNGTSKVAEDMCLSVSNHRKCLRGEKLYFTEDSRKICPNFKRGIICGIIVVVISVVLLLCVLAATGIILSKSESKATRYESGHSLPSMDSVSHAGHSFRPNLPLPPVTFLPNATDGQVSQAPSATVTSKVPLANESLHSQTIVPNALVGEFTIIDENFTDDLNDNNSRGYLNLARNLETELRRIFRESGGKFGTLRILNFRPGSIRVKFVVIWRSAQDIILAEKALEVLASDLRKKNNSFYNFFSVDMNSLHFIDVFDECKFQKGGCSFDCFWDYDTLSKTCYCSHGMYLLPDGTSCVSISETTNSSPTTEESETSFTEKSVPATDVTIRTEDHTQHYTSLVPFTAIEITTEQIQTYSSSAVHNITMQNFNVTEYNTTKITEGSTPEETLIYFDHDQITGAFSTDISNTTFTENIEVTTPGEIILLNANTTAVLIDEKNYTVDRTLPIEELATTTIVQQESTTEAPQEATIKISQETTKEGTTIGFHIAEPTTEIYTFNPKLVYITDFTESATEVETLPTDDTENHTKPVQEMNTTVVETDKVENQTTIGPLKAILDTTNVSYINESIDLITVTEENVSETTIYLLDGLQTIDQTTPQFLSEEKVMTTVGPDVKATTPTLVFPVSNRTSGVRYIDNFTDMYENFTFVEGHVELGSNVTDSEGPMVSVVKGMNDSLLETFSEADVTTDVNLDLVSFTGETTIFELISSNESTTFLPDISLNATDVLLISEVTSSKSVEDFTMPIPLGTVHTEGEFILANNTETIPTTEQEIALIATTQLEITTGKSTIQRLFSTQSNVEETATEASNLNITESTVKVTTEIQTDATTANPATVLISDTTKVIIGQIISNDTTPLESMMETHTEQPNKELEAVTLASNLSDITTLSEGKTINNSFSEEATLMEFLNVTDANLSDITTLLKEETTNMSFSEKATTIKTVNATESVATTLVEATSMIEIENATLFPFEDLGNATYFEAETSTSVIPLASVLNATLIPDTSKVIFDNVSFNDTNVTSTLADINMSIKEVSAVNDSMINETTVLADEAFSESFNQTTTELPSTLTGIIMYNFTNDTSADETNNETMHLLDIETTLVFSTETTTNNLTDITGSVYDVEITTFVPYMNENGTYAEMNATEMFFDMNKSNENTTGDFKTLEIDNFNSTDINYTLYSDYGNYTTTDMEGLLNETTTNATIGIVCREDQFLCEPLNSCLNNSFMCDGIMDCPDEVDEFNCHGSCGSNFLCSNSSNMCIMSETHCDGIWDCENGTDEESCAPTECAKQEVRCTDGSRCIRPSDICDLKYDCKDRSDEVGCVERTTCESGGRFFCNDGLCIPWSLKCDGEFDCKDKEDEGNCTCLNDEFQCNDGKCLKRSSRCDGYFDCRDGDDEMGCVNVDSQHVVTTYEPYSGTWALLCAEDFNLDDGHYLCQELGFGHALKTENFHVSFNGTWMAMRRDNLTDVSLWTERVSFVESCTSSLAAAVECQKFACGEYSGLLHRRKRDVLSSSSSSSQWPFIGYTSTVNSNRGCLSEILTPIWLTTSAECLLSISKEPHNGSDWYVKTNIGGGIENDLVQNHEVLRIVSHPHSSKFRSLILRDYDVALIRLKHALVFVSEKIGAICPPEEQVPLGITCFSGVLGTQKPRALPPTFLTINSLALQIMERKNCNSVEHYNNQINQRMLCTQSSEGHTICDNDEGTPLMCLTGINKWFLAGMLTYQRYCEVYSKHPAVFSNLFVMRKFIDQVTGQKQYEVSFNSNVYSVILPMTPSPTVPETTTLPYTTPDMTTIGYGNNTIWYVEESFTLEDNTTVISNENITSLDYEELKAAEMSITPFAVSDNDTTDTPIGFDDLNVTTKLNMVVEDNITATPIVDDNSNATVTDETVTPKDVFWIMKDGLPDVKSENTSGLALKTHDAMVVQPSDSSILRKEPAENGTEEAVTELPGFQSLNGSLTETVLLNITELPLSTGNESSFKAPEKLTLTTIQPELQDHATIISEVPTGTAENLNVYKLEENILGLLTDNARNESSMVVTDKVPKLLRLEELITENTDLKKDNITDSDSAKFMSESKTLAESKNTTKTTISESGYESSITVTEPETTGDTPLLETVIEEIQSAGKTTGLTETTEPEFTTKLSNVSIIEVTTLINNPGTLVFEAEVGTDEDLSITLSDNQSIVVKPLKSLENFSYFEDLTNNTKEDLPSSRMLDNTQGSSHIVYESASSNDSSLGLVTVQSDTLTAQAEVLTVQPEFLPDQSANVKESLFSSANNGTNTENITEDNWQHVRNVTLNNNNETEAVTEPFQEVTPFIEYNGSLLNDSITNLHLSTGELSISANNIDTCGVWERNSNATEDKNRPFFAEWPSLGFLQMIAETKMCAASILSSNFVITSLNCLSFRDGDLDPNKWAYVGGLYHEDLSISPKQNHLISDIIPYPDITMAVLFNECNLALVKLRDQLQMDKYSTSVCLPKAEIQLGQECYTAGWSKSPLENDSEKKFFSIPVDVIPQDVCNNTENYNGFLLDSLICASYGTNSFPTCQMDIGSSLFCLNQDGQFEIHGILTAPNPCDMAKPAVYNSVQNILHWIKNTLLENDSI